MNIVSFYNGQEILLEGILTCVGKGWHNLIIDLIDDLFKLGWNGQVAQVKEKFGGLRFYIGNGTKEIFDRIQKAEEESYHTCEDCGEPGSIKDARHGRYWVLTLCDACHEHTKRVNNQ